MKLNLLPRIIRIQRVRHIALDILLDDTDHKLIVMFKLYVLNMDDFNMIGWYPQLVVQGTITHDKNQQANNNQIDQ